MLVSALSRWASHRVASLVVVAIAAAAGALVAAEPAHAGIAECHLDYSIVWSSDDNTRFQAELTVHNIGSTPTTSWAVLLGFPWGTAPVDVWNATQVSWPTNSLVLYNFRNVSYDGAIAP